MGDSLELNALKAAYKRWDDSKGTDASVWESLLADDVILKSMDSNHKALSFATPRNGKQQVMQYLTDITSSWTMLHWTPEVYVCEGDRIAMFGKCGWTNKATGKSAEVGTAHLWRFKSGRAVEYTELFDSAKVIAAGTP